MTEQRTPTPREIELRKRLADTGIAVHRGGLNYDPMGIDSLVPVVAIWLESELPTDEEIKTIRTVAQKKINRFFNPSAVEGLAVRGANMITLFKRVDGTWTFRRMTWQDGPTWYPKPGTLEEIKAKL